MRKIERQMIQAIVDDRKHWSKDNTRVERDGYDTHIYLHGHKIAVMNFSSEELPCSLFVNNCGYRTNTTKSRLNALIDFVAGLANNGIFQKNWEWYIKINGDIHSFPDDTWIAV